MSKIEVQKALQKIREEMIGQRYRHFKGGIYVVTAIAMHSETEEPLVVYKNFDDPSLVWARPLSMFISEVDHQKYPNVKQTMRFERMDGESICSSRLLRSILANIKKTWIITHSCSETGGAETSLFCGTVLEMQELLRSMAAECDLVSEAKEGIDESETNSYETIADMISSCDFDPETNIYSIGVICDSGDELFQAIELNHIPKA